MFVCLSICLFVCLSKCLSVCLSICFSVCLSVNLYVYQPAVSVSFSQSVNMSVCLFIYDQLICKDDDIGLSSYLLNRGFQKRTKLLSTQPLSEELELHLKSASIYLVFFTIIVSKLKKGMSTCINISIVNLNRDWMEKLLSLKCSSMDSTLGSEHV